MAVRSWVERGNAVGASDHDQYYGELAGYGTVSGAVSGDLVIIANGGTLKVRARSQEIKAVSLSSQARPSN